MTLTQPPSPLLQAIHRKAQHPPCSTCFFDPWQLTVQSVTQEAAHLPAPRLPLAKKIGRRFLFGASRLRNLPTGQVPRKKNNRTHHATRLQKNRTELGGRLFSVSQLTARSGATEEEHASTFPDTRGPRPEQSRAKQKHEPRRKRKVIRGHTRDDTPHCTERQVLEMG